MTAADEDLDEDALLYGDVGACRSSRTAIERAHSSTILRVLARHFESNHLAPRRRLAISLARDRVD